LQVSSQTSTTSSLGRYVGKKQPKSLLLSYY
jgi:hypothetical protein